MNAGATIGVIAITILIVVAIGYTLWAHRPKPVKPPTLEEELQAGVADATRLRISYEGEAEFAEAMAHYQDGRAARLTRELSRLGHQVLAPGSSVIVGDGVTSVLMTGMAGGGAGGGSAQVGSFTSSLATGYGSTTP